jgi:uncharacterized membrane protein YebE (DUF533 family)
MANPITTDTAETAVVTFGGAFLSAILVTGATYLAAAEIAGLAALGVLGYHAVQGNITATPTASAAPAK